MRIVPRKGRHGQTVYFDEPVGGGVRVSVFTWPDGRAEIGVGDDFAFVQLFGGGGGLEDCIGRAEFLVRFFGKARADAAPGEGAGRR